MRTAPSAFKHSRAISLFVHLIDNLSKSAGLNSMTSLAYFSLG